MFLDDEDKIRDMENLTKDEFLKSYSYVTEKEYDMTFAEHFKSLARMIAKDRFDDLDPESVGFIIQNTKEPREIMLSMADYNNDRYYRIYPFYPEKDESYPEWDFSFGEDLYDFLADGYELRFAEVGVHAAIWEDIANGYDEEDVKEDKGIQLYMKYCKDNGITLDSIKQSFSVPDIMHLYVGVPIEEMTTLDFLNEEKQMIEHNISCYSDGNFISKAKKGYETQFAKEQQKLVIVEKLISDEKQKMKKYEDRER